MKKTVLIFDYDGTMHETLAIYEPAMKDTFEWLRKEHGIAVPEASSEKIASWLGLNSVDTWTEILPGMPDSLKSEASDRVAAHMAQTIESGGAHWYKDAREQLEYLKSKGYTMVILSNCRISYRNAHWNAFSMWELFDKFYDCESFNFLPKEDIFQYIKEEFAGERYIVIGDRAGDMKCAAANNLPCIGCLYGYGSRDELKDATIIIDSPSELSDAVIRLT